MTGNYYKQLCCFQGCIRVFIVRYLNKLLILHKHVLGIFFAFTAGRGRHDTGLMKNTKQITHLPFFVYYSVVVFLSLGGLADSIYLAFIHYRNYTDIGYISFCAISKSINCDTVSQSPYAVFFGLPVAVWGIIGYLFFSILLVLAGNRRSEKQRIWALMFLTALAFSICSIILALISTFYIHSYCIMCIVNYAINFLLLYFVWIIRKRFDRIDFIDGLKKDIIFLWNIKYQSGLLVLAFFIALIAVIIFLPRYWHYSLPPLSADIPTGMTQDGHPWIGAEHPELIIEEFADYQCFQCNKLHYFLRHLVAKHKSKIRLIHRHYPMDHDFNPVLVRAPYHVGSGKMALLAIYAGTKGKFWEMHGILMNYYFEPGPILIKALSAQVGLEAEDLSGALNHPVIRRKLMIDISDGMRMGITGTPAYIVDGKVFIGQIPFDVLNNAINQQPQ